MKTELLNGVRMETFVSEYCNGNKSVAALALEMSRESVRKFLRPENVDKCWVIQNGNSFTPFTKPHPSKSRGGY